MYHFANTDWMRGSFGISVHWTSKTVFPDGSVNSYEDAVNAFEPDTFAETLESIGAKHCIFTLTHAQEYLALPHPVLERLMPGRTTARDLIGELMEALAKRNIRFIAYYNHSCNGVGDPEWMRACGYSAGIRGNLDLFAENICGIVEFMAKRYGNALSGWWFDISYSVDPRGPHNSISCEMGSWQFPWEKLSAAAKAGYPDCAVSFNAGVGSRFLYTPCQDYYAGESVSLAECFFPEAVPGMTDHRWICSDSPDWVFCGKKNSCTFVEPRFPDDALRDFIAQHRAAGRMVTLNLLIERGGKINPYAIAQLRRIRPSL